MLEKFGANVLKCGKKEFGKIEIKKESVLAP